MPSDEQRRGSLPAGDAPRRPLPLEATGVTLQIGARRIVDEVNLSLSPGSLTAVTGPSGAGKSTLLWILAGALQPSSGSLTYGGTPVVDRAGAARDGIALVPQGGALVAPLTARENIVVPLVVLGVPADEAGARADAVLEQLQLADSATHLVEELSGGQQQRVAVGRALAMRASVLLADEPTSEIDAGTRDIVMGLLAAQAQAGALVVVATHDAWCADQAQAQYHLDEGRLHQVR